MSKFAEKLFHCWHPVAYAREVSADTPCALKLLDEHLVLVERHQAAQPARRQLVQHQGGAGLVAPVLLERRLVVLVVGWGLMVAPFDWNLGGLPRDPVPVDAIPDMPSTTVPSDFTRPSCSTPRQHSPSSASRAPLQPTPGRLPGPGSSFRSPRSKSLYTPPPLRS